MRISEKHGVNPMLGVCFFCGKDSGVIALLGRLPEDKEAPRRGVVDLEPCEECKAKMAQGVTLIEATGPNAPTGRWVVVTEEAIRRIVQPEALAVEILKKRKAFVPVEAWSRLGLAAA